MLKLLKYELRKNRTALIILLAVTLALECYFLYGLYAPEEFGTEQDIHLLFAMTGLMLSAYAAVIYVLIVGVTTYTREMKDRSAYLIFMTPSSGLKIMGSKYLFTLVLGLMLAVVYAGLAVLDISLFSDRLLRAGQLLQQFDRMLLEMGIHLDQFLLAALVMAIYALLSIFSFFAVAYLAITLSHTLFRDKKWRGIVSVAIFFALNWGISQLSGLLPNPLDTLTYRESAAAIKIAEAYGLQTTATLKDILLAMLPSMGLSLATILVSLFGCAWMLDKKVSL